MYHVNNGLLMEEGDWEHIQKLEKRIVELEDNVKNLVAWAMKMQEQISQSSPTIEKIEETSEVNNETSIAE